MLCYLKSQVNICTVKFCQVKKGIVMKKENTIKEISTETDVKTYAIRNVLDFMVSYISRVDERTTDIFKIAIEDQTRLSSVLNLKITYTWYYFEATKETFRKNAKGSENIYITASNHLVDILKNVEGKLLTLAEVSSPKHEKFATLKSLISQEIWDVYQTEEFHSDFASVCNIKNYENLNK